MAQKKEQEQVWEAFDLTAPPLTDFRDLVQTTVKHVGPKDAYLVKIKGKDGDTIRHVSFNEFWDEIRMLGTALMELYPERTHIAVMGDSRYEWCLSYLAVTCAGHVVVPVDKELKADEVKMVLTASHSVGILYSDKIYAKGLSQVLDEIPEITNRICMDDLGEELVARKHTALSALLARGKELLESGDTRFDNVVIDPEKLAVLIFTSGTTGVAKGVMLSQKNICSNINSVVQCLDHGPEDSMLSILPNHHTFECTCTFLVSVRMGACVSFCEGLRYIAKNIQEYQPTIIMLVPLIIENVHAKILKNAKSSKVKYIGFKFLMGLSGVLNFFGIDAGKKLFPQVHQTLGGKLRLLIAGAAAMSPSVSKDLAKMGIKIRQGYGLTECSPILCVNQEIKNDYASVGPAMPGVTIKLGDPDEEGRGEILAKGDNIMLGYYENEEATKAVFTEDGWFKTGDQAYMDKNGCFHITGRIKNLIVTKTGKNIFPEELEALINKVPFVKESVVWGDDGGMEADTDICVTIVPNPDGFKEAGIEDPTTEVMEKMLWEEVKKINKDLVTYKRIKRMELRMEEFEKTTTHKIKRYKLEHK